MQFLWRRLARRVEPIGIAEISLLDVDAGIVNKDVDMAEAAVNLLEEMRKRGIARDVPENVPGAEELIRSA